VEGSWPPFLGVIGTSISPHDSMSECAGNSLFMLLVEANGRIRKKDLSLLLTNFQADCGKEDHKITT